MPFRDAVKYSYIVAIKNKKSFFVDVWWSVNLPNNPSPDEILEEFVEENHGDNVAFEYCLVNGFKKYETGALTSVYPEFKE